MDLTNYTVKTTQRMGLDFNTGLSAESYVVNAFQWYSSFASQRTFKNISFVADQKTYTISELSTFPNLLIPMIELGYDTDCAKSLYPDADYYVSSPTEITFNKSPSEHIRLTLISGYLTPTLGTDLVLIPPMDYSVIDSHIRASLLSDMLTRLSVKLTGGEKASENYLLEQLGNQARRAWEEVEKQKTQVTDRLINIGMDNNLMIDWDLPLIIEGNPYNARFYHNLNYF